MEIVRRKSATRLTYLFLDTGVGTRFAVTAAITIAAMAVVTTLVGVPVAERYCRRLIRSRTQRKLMIFANKMLSFITHFTKDCGERIRGTYSRRYRSMLKSRRDDDVFSGVASRKRTQFSNCEPTISSNLDGAENRGKICAPYLIHSSFVRPSVSRSLRIDLLTYWREARTSSD